MYAKNGGATDIFPSFLIAVLLNYHQYLLLFFNDKKLFFYFFWTGLFAPGSNIIMNNINHSSRMVSPTAI